MAMIPQVNYRFLLPVFLSVCDILILSAPVDAFPAQNRWGIHGVIGNVWEWTSTWYTARHSPLPKTNDTGPPKGTDRVKKGGSFLCTTQYCYRNGLI